MDKPLRVIDLTSHRDTKKNKEKEEWVKEMTDILDGLKKAIDEGRLTQIVMQWEEILPEKEQEKDSPVFHTAIIHWNEDYDIDTTIGFAARLKHRLLILADSQGCES